MCGIAGILFKNDSPNLNTGHALIDMLDGCQHRGPDSTGFALYEKAQTGQLRLRFFVGEGGGAEEAVGRIKAALSEHDARIVEEEVIGNNYRAIVDFTGNLRKFSYSIEHAARVISIGSSLEIVKDVGTAEDVDVRYHVHKFAGSHGLGHVRLATESDVKPEASHPFWASPWGSRRAVKSGGMILCSAAITATTNEPRLS